MKILITGEKSYVGISLREWLSQWPDKYSVDFMSLKNDDWKNKQIADYDVLFHVAAVVHKRETPEMKNLYSAINRDLTVELALKAKQAGIKQFIFMSSMSVYGLEGSIGKEVLINKNTPCIPNTLYGISKLQAEVELNKLANEKFKIAIIRAPMIYGPNCPGNYEKLKKLVMKSPLFPLINNQRSMIFIDNFSEFVRLLVDKSDCGLFFPQNKEYINTAELVELITKANSKRVHLSKTLALIIKLLGNRVNVVKKLFGNLVFDKSLSSYRDYNYSLTSFEKSIYICEKNLKE